MDYRIIIFILTLLLSVKYVLNEYYSIAPMKQIGNPFQKEELC
jgi:hypothetical protein